MRAPDTKVPLDDDWANRSCIDRTELLLLAAHTDEQWAKVEKILEAVGVDADDVLIGPGISAKQAWTIGGFVDESIRCSLREELIYIIERCRIDLLVMRPTPQELAREQDRTIRLCRDLAARLDDPSMHNRIDPETDWAQFPHLLRLERHIGAELQAYVAELKRCREEAAGMGTSRGKHNRELHVQFWKALDRVWRDNVSGAKWKAKQLAKFLIACSQPFFPEDTTDTAINAFIERHRISSK